MELSERIRTARKIKGLTQQQLGELVGYTGRSAELNVQHWESGRRIVPMSKLKLISAALDIPLEELIP